MYSLLKKKKLLEARKTKKTRFVNGPKIINPYLDRLVHVRESVSPGRVSIL